MEVEFAFLDLKKAFDLVSHKLIWYSLRKSGVPEKYVDFI